MRSFAIVLLATAVLAVPKENLKKQDKRSLSSDIGISAYGYPSYGLSNYGFPSYGLPNYGLGLSGYSTGLGTKVLGSGLTVDNSLTSAYASGLGYGLGTLGGAGVVVGRSDLSSGLGLGVLPSRAPAKAERITGVTLHREVQVPVPVPQPVPVEVTKHVPVPQPVPVKVDRPYPVAVPQPVEVRVPQPVSVSVAQSVPLPVSVTQHVPSTLGVVPSPIGVASSDLVSGRLSLGHLSHDTGHEYNLGSNHLGPISSLSLGSGAFNTGSDFGPYSISGGFGIPLTPHG